jgi:hypothetical protein
LATFRKKSKKIQIVFYPKHENRIDGKEANLQDLGKCRAGYRSSFGEVAGTLDQSAFNPKPCRVVFISDS